MLCTIFLLISLLFVNNNHYKNTNKEEKLSEIGKITLFFCYKINHVCNLSLYLRIDLYVRDIYFIAFQRLSFVSLDSTPYIS